MSKGKPFHDYEVMVGNIGSVYKGTSLAQATDAYMEYEGQSRIGYGRAAYEPVTLFCDGEIVQENTVPVLDFKGRPIWDDAVDVVRQWFRVRDTAMPAFVDMLCANLQAYRRNPPAAQSYWIVDDMGAEGPYLEEAANDKHLPEQAVICAASQEEAFEEFKRMNREGG